MEEYIVTRIRYDGKEEYLQWFSLIEGKVYVRFSTHKEFTCLLSKDEINMLYGEELLSPDLADSMWKRVK